MSKIIYYVAMSLDGFIADESGGVAWLDPFNKVDFDYGYQAFYDGIGTIITGSKTYEQAKYFPGGWSFPGCKTYIFSSRNPDLSGREDLIHWKQDIESLTKSLRKEDKHTWLIGGANLAGQFVNKGCLDELIVSIMPILLGNGRPLFSGVKEWQHMQLQQKDTFPNGVVQLTYSLS